MARANATRDDKNFQKKGVSVAVFPFVESEVVGDGSVFVQLPPRCMITRVISNITTASSTGSATLDLVANGVVLVNEMAVAAANVTDETLIAAAQYLANGGELVLKAGATAPVAGDLVGECIVEYIELDRNILGEYTEMLTS